MPYMAGLASPKIPAPDGVTVTVTVKYYIHNLGQDPYDWASLGVKPDAEATHIVYKNGYTRGQWANFRRRSQPAKPVR